MTTYAPGTPCWVDLASPDPDASRRFYGDLFGWTATVAEDPAAGGYTTFWKDGQAVAAAGPLAGEAQPPSWSVYIATDDAHGVARRVEAAGGKLLVAPMDVMGYGRMAVFLDPAGAAFAVWQPGTMPGADVTGVPGSLSWAELATRDTEGALDFYPAVLGWTARQTSYGGQPYTVWRRGDQEVAGMVAMDGGPWPPDLPPHWTIYFEVSDCDAVAAKASELGGSVPVPPTDVAPGRIAVLGDPHGAYFAVTRPSSG